MLGMLFVLRHFGRERRSLPLLLDFSLAWLAVRPVSWKKCFLAIVLDFVYIERTGPDGHSWCSRTRRKINPIVLNLVYLGISHRIPVFP